MHKADSAGIIYWGYVNGSMTLTAAFGAVSFACCDDSSPLPGSM